MNIAVVGTGYVGLVTGTCFAETGNKVICIDIDHEKIEKLNRGEITIYEPGLEILFDRNIRQGRLSFTTKLEEGIAGAKIIFLALPTPPGEDGSADLKYVLGVADLLANLCELVGADVDSVRKGIGTDSRIGKRFLFPGIGYGGSCFPKDVQALAKSSADVNYDFKILEAVMEVNASQKTKLISRMMQYF